MTYQIHSAYKSFIWWLLAAIMVFSPIAGGAVRLWSVTPVLLIELSLVFLWLLRTVNIRLRGADREPRTTKLDRSILMFLIFAAVSFVFSIYKHESFYAIFRLLGYIGVYYVVVNEFDARMVKRLVFLVVSIGSCLSLYGLLQYFNILAHPWWYPQDFLAATYVNHNHFAGYLELAIPAAISVLFNQALKIKEGRDVKDYIIALVVALIFMIAAFILTQSRGAWASLAISLVVMSAIFARRGIFKVKNIVILILLVVIIFSFVYFGKETICQRLGFAFSGYGNAFLRDARLKIWKGSADMIMHNPLTGTGIGTFIWGFPRFRPEGMNAMANAAHNDYLQMAAEMGMAAPFIMLWIFALIIRTGFAKQGYGSLRSVGCAAGVLSLALHGLIDFNFHIPANMLLFTVYAAIVMKKDV